MTVSARPMLHCILRDAPRGAPLPGGLRAISVDGLRAIVADVDSEQVRTAGSTRLQDYADLVALIHRDVPLIPMRFGCVLASDTAVRTLLSEHQGRLSAMLDQLDDCVELGVRLLLPSPAATAVEALAAAQAAQARGALERVVTGLFRDVHQEFGQIGGRSLLSLYFLVPREHGTAFVDALRRDPSAVPGTGLVTGPWPPYNFVGAIDDDLRPLA